MKKKVAGDIIEGEYDCVARLTANPERLRKAHQEIISPEKARRIVEFFLPGVEVVFRGFKGKANRMKNRISLPSPSNRYSNLNTIYGKVRLGLVMHEVAHMIHKGNNYHHDKEFVKVLDQLLEKEFIEYLGETGL